MLSQIMFRSRRSDTGSGKNDGRKSVVLEYFAGVAFMWMTVFLIKSIHPNLFPVA